MPMPLYSNHLLSCLKNHRIIQRENRIYQVYTVGKLDYMMGLSSSDVCPPQNTQLELHRLVIGQQPFTRDIWYYIKGYNHE